MLRAPTDVGPMSKKIDNQNLALKVGLRRYMLDKYHREGRIDVLDACQGSGQIWAQLRQFYRLDSYLGIDTKHKAGRLQFDSARLLALEGLQQNVIDIDTYASPWKHWQALVCSLNRPTTVFLTMAACQGPHGPNVQKVQKEALGLAGLNVPKVIVGRLQDLANRHQLAWAARRGVEIVEAVRAASGPTRMRYLAIRCRPAGGG